MEKHSLTPLRPSPLPATRPAPVQTPNQKWEACLPCCTQLEINHITYIKRSKHVPAYISNSSYSGKESTLTSKSSSTEERHGAAREQRAPGTQRPWSEVPLCTATVMQLRARELLQQVIKQLYSSSATECGVLKSTSTCIPWDLKKTFSCVLRRG